LDEYGDQVFRNGYILLYTRYSEIQEKIGNFLLYFTISHIISRPNFSSKIKIPFYMIDNETQEKIEDFLLRFIINHVKRDLSLFRRMWDGS